MSKEFEEFLREHYEFLPYPEDTLLVAITKLRTMRYASGMTQVPDMWGTELLAVRDYLLYLETKLGIDNDLECLSEDLALRNPPTDDLIVQADKDIIAELYERTRTIR